MQLYLSSKTEHLSYKGGCSLCERMHIEPFKRRGGFNLAVDKWLQVIDNTNVVKNSYTTKNLKNKPF